jgi:hypothetical protein
MRRGTRLSPTKVNQILNSMTKDEMMTTTKKKTTTKKAPAKKTIISITTERVSNGFLITVMYSNYEDDQKIICVSTDAAVTAMADLIEQLRNQ